MGHITPETAAIFGAIYDPPENLWLKVFFTDSEESQAAGRAFLKRYLSRTQNPDALVSDKVAPAQIAAVGEWGTSKGERFAYLRDIKQPTLVVSGTHDVIVYTSNSLHLVPEYAECKADPVSGRQPRFVVSESRGLRFRGKSVPQ